MIRINLLPIEKRRLEKTPLPRLISIFVGVGLSFGLLVTDVIFHQRLGIAREQLMNLQKERDFKNDQVKEYNDIKQKKEEASARKRTIDQIRGTRQFLWSLEIDKLCDVVNDSPLVWLTSLKCGDGNPPVTLFFGPGKMKPNTPIEFYLLMDCKSATEDKVYYTEFGNKLEEKFLPGRAANDTPAAVAAAAAATPAGGFRFLNDPDLSVETMPQFREEVALRYTLCLVGVKQAPRAGPPGAPGTAGAAGAGTPPAAGAGGS
ncbi:MAG: hypothetical protein HYZ53_27540 [Planctomycetes bacterium]|nr:hypothetical protein [Planctomycetota bacterium]